MDKTLCFQQVTSHCVSINTSENCGKNTWLWWWYESYQNVEGGGRGPQNPNLKIQNVWEENLHYRRGQDKHCSSSTDIYILTVEIHWVLKNQLQSTGCLYGGWKGKKGDSQGMGFVIRNLTPSLKNHLSFEGSLINNWELLTGLFVIFEYLYKINKFLHGKQ